MSLAWTIRGNPPSAVACASIDHLELGLSSDACPGSVVISPVDCTLDRFRYDKLPEGAALIDLQAVDAFGRLVAEGSVRVTLGPVVPATPVPLDVR